MDRRLAGVLMLVAALAAVLVLPSAFGRRVAGTPVATVFPDPPRVGDCLLTPIRNSAIDYGLPPEVPITATNFGPCVGEVAGEVVAEWPDLQTAEQAPTSRRSGTCYPQAATFAGLETVGRSTDLPGVETGGPISWRPTIGFDGLWVTPGIREQHAGRSWRLCLVVPVDRGTYQGSLRNAFTSGSLPSVFGLCWEAADLDLFPAMVKCNQSHPAELLATGVIRNRSLAPTEVIESSCAQIAARIMHTDDPTRGGVLEVVADRQTGGSDGREDSPLIIGCFVTTADARPLVGTVIGLGEDPVPFRT